MKHVLFILIVALSIISCDKDKCTYTLSERDYNLIPYEQNDTIIATLVYTGTSDLKQVQLVVSEGQLSVHDNVGALGKPLCNGTFEVLKMQLQSNNNKLISECIIDIRKDNDCLDVWIRLKVDSYFMIFDMRPFGAEGSLCYDISTEYFSQLTIDGKEYEDVYLIKGDTALKDALYYSPISGLIKLVYQDGVILFKRK